jgi:hypothetical protein
MGAASLQTSVMRRQSPFLFDATDFPPLLGKYDLERNGLSFHAAVSCGSRRALSRGARHSRMSPAPLKFDIPNPS